MLGIHVFVIQCRHFLKTANAEKVYIEMSLYYTEEMQFYKQYFAVNWKF